MNKEKEIEELTEILNRESNCGIGSCENCKYDDGRSVNLCISKKQAEALYNAGYRKNQKDEVILTGRELSLRHVEIVRQVRKETAREIFNLLHESNDLRHIEYFIAQKYGVEVEV